LSPLHGSDLISHFPGVLRQVTIVSPRFRCLPFATRQTEAWSLHGAWFEAVRPKWGAFCRRREWQRCDHFFIGVLMDPSLQHLIDRLDELSEQFEELKEGVRKAINGAAVDPEMALIRARKVLEYLIRDVFVRRVQEPPGTRPLENLIQRLVKDGHLPPRLEAYTETIRKLGNVGAHHFGARISAEDVYQSLTQLMPILVWYFEVERPDAGVRLGDAASLEPAAPAPPAAGKQAGHVAHTAVVPKGLRSFDANDSDFFLQLLPGPRDKDGLPESIRFWKHRIESRDDPSFTVGVIYGPSGCGKSSLVKAGLLPRLARRVVSVYL
jgi:hypothetical protein